MKVVWTDTALLDLESISEFVTANYPAVAPAVERRLRKVVARIGRWPHGARTVAGRPGVHVVPLGRYPYRVFYRITPTAVEILHVHHAARRPWEDEAG
jgi:plasmid stabilization system protein ParE